nr:MAG TPA: endonuclease [Herelleviridae sp.]
MSKQEEKYNYIKLRLLPTKEQESKMWQHVNHSRAIRNILVEEGNRILDTPGEFLYERTLENYFYKIIKNQENYWMKEVSKKSLVTISQKLFHAYERCFAKQSKRPKFHSKKESNKYYFPRSDAKDKFYLDKNNKLKIEKLGRVEISKGSLKSNLEKLHIIQDNDRLRQSVITFDGKYWYISISYKVNALCENQTKRELTNETIGIDLGIKTLATCSNGKSYKNVNKSQKVKNLEKKLKRKQRQVSRKYEMNKDYLTVCLLNKDSKPKRNKQNRETIQKYVRKTNNIIKLERDIKLLHRKLKNIRNTHIHTMTKEIVEQLPQEIVIEDLKVSNMVKNKHLAKHIYNCRWYEIRRQLTYKCEDRGILLTVANTYYPSSQTCSNCGKRLTKQDKLSLSQRTFTCECGTKIDRDLNASLNLKNYRYSKWYQDNINSL